MRRHSGGTTLDVLVETWEMRVAGDKGKGRTERGWRGEQEPDQDEMRSSSFTLNVKEQPAEGGEALICTQRVFWQQ